MVKLMGLMMGCLNCPYRGQRVELEAQILQRIKKWTRIVVHMSQGRSTPCIGDGRPPTFNGESL